MMRVVLFLVLVSLLATPVRSQAQSGPQWIDVEGAQGAKLRAAVYRPAGNGPFPVVVVLHGSTGGRQALVDWGADFARAGFVTLVGCWRAGFICPQGPYIRIQARKNAIALIDAGKRIPGARADRVGLVGWSSGGGLAAALASSGANVQAVVSVAGSFREELVSVPKDEPSALSLVQDLRAPLLILHGTSDSAEPVQTSREYEARARQLGKTVEAYYIDGGNHFMLFHPKFKDEVLRRSVGFLNKYLRP